MNVLSITRFGDTMKYYVFFYDNLQVGILEERTKDEAIKQANIKLLQDYSNIRVEDMAGNTIYEPLKENYHA